MHGDSLIYLFIITGAWGIFTCGLGRFVNMEIIWKWDVLVSASLRFIAKSGI